MKTGQSPGRQRELLCINTEKVYDWVLNEATFDLSIDDLPLPVNPATQMQLTCNDIDESSVSCEITGTGTDLITDEDRVNQTFIIDGREVTLQVVTIRKNFTVSIYANLVESLGGGRVLIGEEYFTRCEQVILCAPTETYVDVEFTNVDCFVCQAVCVPYTGTESPAPPDELDVTVSVRLCQSIQSTYPVTLEIEAEFCEPRDIFPFPPCPSPARPPQCPVVFPNNLGGNDGANG